MGRTVVIRNEEGQYLSFVQGRIFFGGKESALRYDFDADHVPEQLAIVKVLYGAIWTVEDWLGLEEAREQDKQTGVI